MRADLFWPFLIFEVSYSFHHNQFLQEPYVSLKATIMYILLNTWSVICNVKVSHNKLDRYLDLYSSPCCCELPGSAEKKKNRTYLNTFTSFNKVNKQKLNSKYNLFEKKNNYILNLFSWYIHRVLQVRFSYCIKINFMKAIPKHAPFISS